MAFILPDAIVGSSELIALGPEALNDAGSTTARQVALVRYDGPADELEQRLSARSDGAGVRVFGGAGGDDQRDRDRAVLAQLLDQRGIRRVRLPTPIQRHG